MEASTFRKEVLKSGVMIALVNIILTLVLYVLDPALLGSMWLGFGILALNLILFVFAGISLRKRNGGILSFKNAFVFIFLAVAVSTILGTGFNILLHHVIDPELSQIVANAMVENTVSMMETMGAPAETIDETVAKTRNDMLASFSLSKQMQSLAWGVLLGGLIIGLIGGAIAMKKPSIES